MRHYRRLLVSGVFVAALTLSSFLLVPGRAMAHPSDPWWCGPGHGSSYCNGEDPQATGCSSGATTIASTIITDGLGTDLAYLELRWSGACGTNWVRITAMVTVASMYAKIWDYCWGSPAYTSPTVDWPSSGSSTWTPMVYAPNNAVTMEGHANTGEDWNWSGCLG